MKIIVGGIVQKEDKILMVKEAKKKCYGKWNIPAGHLEEGETIHEGAIREIFEETGCKVELIGMLPIINRKIENATDTLILITFIAKLKEEKICFNEEEILDVKWISKKELENMNNESLRDEKWMKKTLEDLKVNKLYPLDLIEIL